MDVGMSSIQAYKIHKQEGTLVPNTKKSSSYNVGVTPQVIRFKPKEKPNIKPKEKNLKPNMKK